MGVNCEDLTPAQNEESSSEGSSVTLSYTYSLGDYFYWYRQYPGKQPEYLLHHLASGDILRAAISGLTIKAKKNLINMTISSAAVTDSAVYYCVLRPTVTGNTKTLYKNSG
ncbi:unnamed protein product [Xyrichtys novacula]|uniref:Unnamed protein product n=1 Tax=Xyrichtys novacula TaxID=13765 RepID=A0AAV1GI49_XYRNO|nr:unnamed protein product [Xyrichtys novacula]